MKVFLSSTYVDLVEHRKAAHDALEQLGLHVIWMEAFGARPEESTKAYLDEVEEYDIFVGIYAHRYGYIPKDAKVSITEQEFDRAQKLGKPIFGFIIDSKHPWPPDFIEWDKKANLNIFLEKVKKQSASYFTTPENLAENILSVFKELSFSNHISSIIRNRKPTITNFIPPRLSSETNGEISTIESVIYKQKYLIILGPPGSGKTSTLKHLEYEIATQNVENVNLLPIYIDMSLIEQSLTAEENLDRILSIHINEGTKKIIRKKELMFLVDNIDALPHNLAQGSFITYFLRLIGEKYPNSRIIGASRKALFGLSNFKTLIIQPFNQAETIEFLKKHTSKWKDLYQVISESRQYSRFKDNPLFLGLFCEFQEDLLSPNILLDPIIFLELFQQKVFSKSPILEQNRNHVTYLLEQIAAYLWLKGEIFISENQIIKLEQSIFSPQYSPNALNHDTLNIVLAELSNLLLTRTENDNYYFLHLTLHEYYFTKYLRKLTDNPTFFSVLDYRKDTLVGIKILNIRSESGLRKIIRLIVDSTRPLHISVTPVYSIRGSIIIALAFGAVIVIGSALRKFVDAFFEKLGEDSADYLLGNEPDSFKLPPELDNEIPSWVKKDPALLKRFIYAVIDKKAEIVATSLDAEKDTKIAQVYLENVISTSLGSKIEVLPANRILSLHDEETKIGKSHWISKR